MNNSELKDTKYCFFITPIGPEHSESYKKMTAIEDNILSPLLEENNLQLEIAHKIDTMGSISDQIFKYIVNADLIIANLTDLNANVMYETAVAHSFDIPTIMITEDINSLPFDLKMDRSIEFSNTIEGSGYLRSELYTKVKNIMDTSEFDNPIKRAVERVATKEKLSGDTSIESTIVKSLDIIQERLYKLEKNNNKQRNYLDGEYSNYSKYLSSNKSDDYKYLSQVKNRYFLSDIGVAFSDTVTESEKLLIKDAVSDLNSTDSPITHKNVSKITGIPYEKLEKMVVFREI